MNKLITYAFMKEETDIAQTVDNTKLDNPIKNACDRLKFIIGKAFYDQLVAQVITTPKTLSIDNDAFFDPYVKQFIAWQAYQFYISKANTYETRVGVRVFKEDNSDAASDKIMGEQISLAKQQLQVYKDAMINFLNTEQRLVSTKYPLYTNTCGNVVGSSFGISAVSKKRTVGFSIYNATINQEP